VLSCILRGPNTTIRPQREHVTTSQLPGQSSAQPLTVNSTFNLRRRAETFPSASNALGQAFPPTPTGLFTTLPLWPPWESDDYDELRFLIKPARAVRRYQTKCPPADLKLRQTMTSTTSPATHRIRNGPHKVQKKVAAAPIVRRAVKDGFLDRSALRAYSAGRER
jgi:hypothetical protein